MFRFIFSLAIIFGALQFASQPASAAPEGIPADAIEAKVFERIDGDKFKVRIGDEIRMVNLIGADAPETIGSSYGECYAIESSNYVTKLLPVGSSVWLEADAKDHDGRDRLLRYVWIERAEGKPFMINQRLVQQGYASFKDDDDNNRYDSRLSKAEVDAKEAGKGIWKSCDGPHDQLDKESETTRTIDYQLSGNGNSAVNVTLTAGTYGILARCQTDVLFVYINDLSGSNIDFPVARDPMNEDSSNITNIPYD
ncbi:MAG: thermonuclease family protein, partial [Thermomicrobiales bacterium]